MSTRAFAFILAFVSAAFLVPIPAMAQEMKYAQKTLHDSAAKSLYQGESYAGWGPEHHEKARAELESADADIAELRKTLPNHPAVLELAKRAEALRALLAKKPEPAKPEEPQKTNPPVAAAEPKPPDAAEIKLRIEIIRTDMKYSERWFQTWLETAGNPDLAKIFPVEAGYSKIDLMQAGWAEQTKPAIWHMRDCMIQLAVLKSIAAGDKDVAALAADVERLCEKVLYSAARAKAPKEAPTAVQKQLIEGDFRTAAENLAKAEASFNEYQAAADKAKAAKHDWQKKDAMGLADTCRNDAYDKLKLVRSGDLAKIMEKAPDDPRVKDLKAKMYDLYAKTDLLERSFAVYVPAHLDQARQMLLAALGHYEASQAGRNAAELEACLKAHAEVMNARDLGKYCFGAPDQAAFLKDCESASDEIRAKTSAAAAALVADLARKGDVRECEAVLKALAKADPDAFREKHKLYTEAGSGRADTLAMLQALDKRMLERVEKASAAAAGKGFDAFVAKQTVVKTDRKAILANFDSFKGKFVVSSFKDLLFDPEGWYLDVGADVWDFQFSEEALARTKALIAGQDKIFEGFHNAIVSKMNQKGMAYLWKFPKFIDATFVAAIDGTGKFIPKKDVYNEAGEVIGQVDGDPVPIVAVRIVAVKSRYLTFWPGGTDTVKETDTAGMLDGILK